MFCEVKSKSTLRHGHPAEMVDAEKRRRIRVAASGWLRRNPAHAGLGVRYDIVAITGRRLVRLSDPDF